MTDHRGLAVGVDRGDEIRTAVELGPARHVLAVSVGVPGADDDLLCVLRLQDGDGRQQFEALDTSIVGARPRRAAGDPVGEDAIIRRTGFDLLSAAVGYRLRRLKQEQASPRLISIDAPSQCLPRQCEMVAIGIVAAQRQFQSALAGQRTVTCPGVTTRPCHQRDDVIAKTPSVRLLRLANRHLDRRLFAVHAGCDCRLAIADGTHNPDGIHDGNARMRGRKLRLRRAFADDLTVLLRDDEQTLSGVRAG